VVADHQGAWDQAGMSRRQDGWYFSGDAVRFPQRGDAPPQGARKGSRNASFVRRAGGLIDICHSRYDDEVCR